MRIYTFEGLDGVGKTTLIEKVKQSLEHDYKITVLREPGATPVGEAIRSILKSSLDISSKTEVLLFMASRSQMVETLLPTLDCDILIIDRYQDSTIAYQGFGQGHDIQWLDLLTVMLGTNINIDQTFYIEVPDHIIKERTVDRQIDQRFERDDFQQRVKNGYNYLRKRYPQRITTIENIDSEQATRDILSHIHQHIRKDAALQ